MTAFDALVYEQMQLMRVPGMEVAVVKNGGIAFEHGYGFAELRQYAPVTVDTVFRLASVSKTVTMTTLMSLFEQGKFKLDDPINDALKSFHLVVKHPRFPNKVITYRMLLTHTAAIADNYDCFPYNWTGDYTAMPLADLVDAYFNADPTTNPHPGCFDAAKNFVDAEPGTRYRYSNFGIALAGRLAEIHAQRAFAVATSDIVFRPLGMIDTSWKGDGFVPRQGTMAMPYQVLDAQDADPSCEDLRNGYCEYKQYGYGDTPAGMLRTSGAQLAKFMAMYMSDGVLNDARVLEKSTIDEIKRPQLDDAIRKGQGLVLYYDDITKRVIGHNGGDEGIRSEMYWIDDPVPANRYGIIMLMNAEPYQKAGIAALDTVFQALFQKGARL